MKTTVCIAVPSTLLQVGSGAYLWIFINWALGLRAADCRVFWLEALPQSAIDFTPQQLDSTVASHRERLEPFGLADDFILMSFEHNTILYSPENVAIQDIDLLLNFVYDAPNWFVRQFRRSALVDIDPGLLQIWISRKEIEVADHDTYFTIGETVGTEHARFPDCGRRWLFTPPPVHLPEWPLMDIRADGFYTTVTGWWDEWMELSGEIFSNEKRTAFLDYLDLPSLSPGDLELAIILDSKTATEDVPLFTQHGWSMNNAMQVCATLEHFRHYVHGSRGEFTCARPSSLRLKSTWIGDRTLCYLASGKPVIVEATAPSRFDFQDQGLIRFSTPKEAANALTMVESEYADHCRRARQIAETHFDAALVACGVLERALL